MKILWNSTTPLGRMWIWEDTLSDNLNNLDKFEIPAGTTVPAGGHLIVICSGEGELVTNSVCGRFPEHQFQDQPMSRGPSCLRTLA